MKAYIFQLTHTPATLITLSEVKAQLKIEDSFTDDDDLLNFYRDAAIKYAESYTSRCFNQSKWRMELFGFENYYAFKKSPVTSIDKVEYLDTDGNWQTLAAEKYELKHRDELTSVIEFTDFDELPSVKSGYGVRVKIEITAGYETANDLPNDDKAAIFLIFTNFYEKRDDSVQALPRASTNLLKRFYFTPDE